MPALLHAPLGDICNREEFIETFEKCSFLFKFKPLACGDYAPKGDAKILTEGIHRVFLGLQFECDTEIEQKGAFCIGL
jgi:hypothetical protein